MASPVVWCGARRMRTESPTTSNTTRVPGRSPSGSDVLRDGDLAFRRQRHVGTLTSKSKTARAPVSCRMASAEQRRDRSAGSPHQPLHRALLDSSSSRPPTGHTTNPRHPSTGSTRAGGVIAAGATIRLRPESWLTLATAARRAASCAWSPGRSGRARARPGGGRATSARAVAAAAGAGSPGCPCSRVSSTRRRGATHGW